MLNKELATTLNENVGHMTTELFQNEFKNINKSAGKVWSIRPCVPTEKIIFWKTVPRAYLFKTDK